MSFSSADIFWTTSNDEVLQALKARLEGLTSGEASASAWKRLSAIHDLGAMDVLCTDKTGTLTEAKIAHVGSVGVDGKDSARVTDLIRLNSRFASGMRSNLDNAILTGMPVAADDWTHVDDLPFDFERRRASVLVARGGERELITKGAPEALLSLCRQMEAADPLVSLMEEKGRQVCACSVSRGGAWRPIAGTSN